MRPSWGAVAGGVLVVAVGVAGLIRGELPQSVPSTPTASSVGAVTVVNPYIVAPVPPTRLAAGYFTVYNTTNQPDTLQSVQTGAGQTAVLHTLIEGLMTVDATGVVVPAHGTLKLSVGTGHVMIGQLIGQLKPGQQVDMILNFAHAGEIDVTAPVIKVGQPPPGTSATGSSASGTPASGQSSPSPSSSGAHS